MCNVVGIQCAMSLVSQHLMLIGFLMCHMLAWQHLKFNVFLMHYVLNLHHLKFRDFLFVFRFPWSIPLVMSLIMCRLQISGIIARSAALQLIGIRSVDENRRRFFLPHCFGVQCVLCYLIYTAHAGLPGSVLSVHLHMHERVHVHVGVRVWLSAVSYVC